MSTYASDVAHDRADIFARNDATRSDRIATHARFTPQAVDDDTPVPDDVAAIDVVGRVRVSSRWTGAEDPDRANLIVVTVDDKGQGAALGAWPLWRVETWTPVPGSQYAKATWWWAVDYRVAVDGCLVTPAWVELEGWSQIVRGGYGEDRAGAAPPWLTGPEAAAALATAPPSRAPGWR